MAEFRPAVPQLADFGSAFQKGMASGMSAVQDKRNYALKLRTAAMQEERFGWEKKEQMTAEYLKKVNKSFVDESIWGDPMAEVKGISSMWADGKADSVMSMVGNRIFSNANKQNFLDVYNSVNAGNPEASQAMFDVEFRKRQEQENLKIFTVMQNGLKFQKYLNPDGSDRRDKQIYSQLVVDNPAFQAFANEAGNTTIMQQFDWSANQTTIDSIKESLGDTFRTGTLLGDTKNLVQDNPMLAPLAALPLVLPVGAGVAAYKKWGPSSKTSKVGEFGAKSKLPNVLNESQSALQRAKDRLKVDGKKFPKTAAGDKAQKAAQTKAQNAVDKAQANIDRYNKRLSGTEKHMKIKKAKSYGKWFAPTIGGAVGSVFGEKGEAVGSGAGGAYLMQDAARKGGKGLTRFVLAKLGAKIPAAMAASAMDGPLPFGEILSLGVGAWTIWSAIQEYNSLK